MKSKHNLNASLTFIYYFYIYIESIDDIFERLFGLSLAARYGRFNQIVLFIFNHRSILC
jgi:hypothetical protein